MKQTIISGVILLLVLVGGFIFFQQNSQLQQKNETLNSRLNDLKAEASAQKAVIDTQANDTDDKKVQAIHKSVEDAVNVMYNLTQDNITTQFDRAKKVMTSDFVNTAFPQGEKNKDLQLQGESHVQSIDVYTKSNGQNQAKAIAIVEQEETYKSDTRKNRLIIQLEVIESGGKWYVSNLKQVSSTPI